MRPRRSVLYMPGSNARALEKAKTLAADALILDLEDAVAPDAKEVARSQVCAAVKAGGFGPREVSIRVNGFATPYGAADFQAALEAKPDAILLPKIETPADLEHARKQAPSGCKIPLWAMIETPLAILNLKEIGRAAASAELPLTCFVLGTNDLIKMTRIQAQADQAAAPRLAVTYGGGRAGLRHHRRRWRLQFALRRGGLPRGVPPRPRARHGWKNADPSEPDRGLQRGLLAVCRGDRGRPEDRRGVRTARKSRQGRNQPGRAHGRAAACGHRP